MDEQQQSDGQKQVLVADDPAILRLVKVIVEKEGYAVKSRRATVTKHINFYSKWTEILRRRFSMS